CAIGLVWGLTDRRIRLSANVEAWTGRVVGTACVVAAALLLTFSFTTWHASHRIHRAWHQFTSEHPKTGVSSHFSSGLGGGRYDFWRVALAEFKARPIGGVGADNFALGYLEKRKTTEEPLYPHSFELRFLAGTGPRDGHLARRPGRGVRQAFARTHAQLPQRPAEPRRGCDREPGSRLAPDAQELRGSSRPQSPQLVPVSRARRPGQHPGSRPGSPET